ncbi:CsbD family protein [Piscinibacter koreensis]|uniref:CsbD family protein n=1 Tax=Piscinibacter koreensis TaxID=2742824 RepID=A0A7Y6NJE7_9BURK|nr:CsbD family protein [Schlegelella koreensis]NUZ04268.1 CsbD family protein [Schlegelella koreensis]
MNDDQVKGRVDQAKGAVKEAAGKVVGNPNLEAEGKVDKATGKTQATYGDVKEDVKDAVNGRRP